MSLAVTAAGRCARCRHRRAIRRLLTNRPAQWPASIARSTGTHECAARALRFSSALWRVPAPADARNNPRRADRPGLARVRSFAGALRASPRHGGREGQAEGAPTRTAACRSAAGGNARTRRAAATAAWAVPRFAARDRFCRLRDLHANGDTRLSDGVGARPMDSRPRCSRRQCDGSVSRWSRSSRSRPIPAAA